MKGFTARSCKITSFTLAFEIIIRVILKWLIVPNFLPTSRSANIKLGFKDAKTELSMACSVLFFKVQH